MLKSKSLFASLVLLGITFANVSEAIVGGSVVQYGDPISSSIVGLRIGVTPDGRYGGCTGTIISNNLILTAAHCVVDKKHGQIPAEQIQIVFGRQLNDFNAPYVKPWVVAVDGRYNNLQGREAFDLALLAFHGNLPQGYKPVRVDDLNNERYVGDMLTLAGFGVTNGFNDTGSGTLRKTEVPIWYFNGGREIVVDQRYGKGACRGDSGGPAFIRRGSEYHYVGVTSRGAQLCNEHGIYTSANDMIDFINEARVVIYEMNNSKEPHDFYSLKNVFELNWMFKGTKANKKVLAGRCYQKSNPTKAIGAAILTEVHDNQNGMTFSMTDAWDQNNASAFDGLSFNTIMKKYNLSMYGLFSDYDNSFYHSDLAGTNYYAIRGDGKLAVAELRNSRTHEVVGRCIFDRIK